MCNCPSLAHTIVLKVRILKTNSVVLFEDHNINYYLMFYWNYPKGYIYSSAPMTFLTITEYLCHKLPRIWSVCRNHNPVLFLFITYHWICSKSKMTGATSGAATAHPSRAYEFAAKCIHPLHQLQFFLWQNIK